MEWLQINSSDIELDRNVIFLFSFGNPISVAKPTKRNYRKSIQNVSYARPYELLYFNQILLTYFQGNTLLHYACREGKIDAVHFLLSKGASPTIKNKLGLTPMDLVPSKHPKRSEILNLLSEHTLLRPEIIKAAEKGDIKGVKTALTNGDDVDTPDKVHFHSVTY